MERTILHCDCDSFFASVESVLNPSLKSFPMAVAGDPEERCGIILAKNELAKGYGVKTAETIWEAKKKCPQLITVPPHYEEYEKYSCLVNKIYQDYTDLCEPFGIDETFLDIGGSLRLFNSTGEELAKKIQNRVLEQTGLTISIGISFNKTFAKLGSDYKKPFGTTLITKENFKDKVFNLPVDALLYVGRRTGDALIKHGIFTIGDLAKADVNFLKLLLGKNGIDLKNKANGIDNSPVLPSNFSSPLKSLGNGITFPYDLKNDKDIRSWASSITDVVTTRMRKHNLNCNTVSVHIKYNDFSVFSKQKRLSYPTNHYQIIYGEVIKILLSNKLKPIRSITVTGLNLTGSYDTWDQGDFFTSFEEKEKNESLESAVFSIKTKYGRESILPATAIKTDSYKLNTEIHSFNNH